MPSRFEIIKTTAIVLVAAAAVSSAMTRVGRGRVTRDTQLNRASEHLVGWRDALPNATRIAGQQNAPVTIVVLADLQCPICRAFHETALKVIAASDGQVQMRHLHYPLGYHEWALGAARGAECALEVSEAAFAAWLSEVYERQEDLGRVSWSELAAEAGMPDPQRFEECAQDARLDRRIDAGRAYGDQIGLTGTPTVIVNGLRYSGAPTESELTRIVDSLTAGGSS